MNFKKLGLLNVLMLLLVLVTGCSKGDDNTIDPGTTPTSKLPTLKLSANTNNAFVNEEINFIVIDDKGNRIEDAKLYINEQSLPAKTFSSKTAATFKIYAQKAGYKTSNTIEIRFIEKDAVDAVVTGKWKFSPSSIESIFDFKEDMTFSFTQAGKTNSGTYQVKGNKVQMTLINGSEKDEDYGVINISEYTANTINVELIIKGIFQKGQTGKLERMKDSDNDGGENPGGGDDDDNEGTANINLAMFYGEWRGYEDNNTDYSLKMKFKNDKMEAESKNSGKYNPVLYMLDDMRYYSLHDSSTLIMTGKKSYVTYYFRVSNYNNNEIQGTLYFSEISANNSVKITLRRK
ncbi:MAG: hypothetical protein LBI72_02340 [Flavobacteriaceae bacterium]|jgi:hypothetical protein|nr:hypothetical protein [Flavobacteriaceae bacterium]